MRKLKTTEVTATRESLLEKQGKKCEVCQLPCTTSEAVLDHEHTTGSIRATLHRSCNALLGKIENNFKRYGVKNLAAFLHGVPAYLQRHETDQHGLLHPTHKTPDEKRVARNAKARKARASKKVAE